jgi:predicted transposase/invertase (TIGR01784 family)
MNQTTVNETIVPLKNLNLTSRFLFDEVMEDVQSQQDVLSIVLGHDVPLLTKNETEKELRISPMIRSVRMDVFSMDEEHTVYNTEMQGSRKYDLEKRSRYYQALLDTSLLNPGIPDYNRLNNTYLIMIMTFDLFGEKKYCYTFRPRCEEVPKCILKDGTIRIFLNTKGTNDGEVSSELVEFLHYVENTTDQQVSQTSSARIRRIHERVRKVKSSEEIGVKYMQAWEEKYYDRQEAREQGIREGLEKGSNNKLKEQITKKLEKGKSAEEIADALEEDIETIQSLIDEIQKEDLTASQMED